MTDTSVYDVLPKRNRTLAPTWTKKKYDLDKEVDLNVTLEDEVFSPRSNAAKPESRVSEPKDTGKTCSCPNKFTRLPNLFGRPQQDHALGSLNIAKLSRHAFDSFLGSNGNVMVMFYESVNNKMPPETEYFRKQLAEAAESTKKGDHAYAIVDCTKETDLCGDVKNWDLEFKKYPFFLVFAYDKIRLRIMDPTGLDAKKMRRIMQADL